MSKYSERIRDLYVNQNFFLAYVSYSYRHIIVGAGGISLHSSYVQNTLSLDNQDITKSIKSLDNLADCKKKKQCVLLHCS